MTNLKPNNHFRLSDAERASPLWGRLVQHMEQRIASLHIELENAADEIKSNKLRGRIHAFRELLVLDKDSPPGP